MSSFTDGKMYIRNHIREPYSSKHENKTNERKQEPFSEEHR